MSGNTYRPYTAQCNSRQGSRNAEIYQAATDGTDQLRYTAGADAVEITSNRKLADDATWLAGIRAQFGR